MGVYKGCTLCGAPKPPIKGRHYCDECREKAHSSKRKKGEKGRYVCIKCGGPRNKWQRMCWSCREDKEQRICPICKTAPLAKKHIYCDDCKDYKRHIKLHVCSDCLEPAVTNRDGTKPYCMKHWLEILHRCHFGGPEGWERLAQIWERQEGRCIYSGEQLVPRLNASLDHVVPRSKGGAISIENVQFVTKDVNLMKSNISEQVFLTLCRRIAIHNT